MKLSKKYLEEAKCELSTPTPEQVMLIETKEAISPSPELSLGESIPPPPPESDEDEIPPPPPESAESDIPLDAEISRDYPSKSPVKSISLTDDQSDPDMNISQSVALVESHGDISKEILTCDSVLKSGPRKGQKCGKSAKVDGKCNIHKKTSRTTPTPLSLPLEQELSSIPSPSVEQELSSSSPPLEEELIPPPPPSPPIEKNLMESWPVVQIEEKDLLNILKKTKVMDLDTMQMNFLQQELDKIFS